MPFRSAAALFLLFAAAVFASAQTWVPLKNQPNTHLKLGNPLLLTDGTVIAHQYCGSAWYKLTPNLSGSYLNGTWKQIASLPAGYAPVYFSSAVLPDGRVIIEGGEYNFSNGGCDFAWTTLGAVYDPVQNKWTSVAPPKGWKTIGDAESVILPNGTYMQANCCTRQQALLNSKTLTWTTTGKGKSDINDEEGWTLLPDGTVLTVDAYVNHYLPGGMNYEIYDPTSGAWNQGAPTGTGVQLWDSYPNAKTASYEVGPAVLRPDGTVFATGANGTPGQSGHTSIYDTTTQTWTPGPDFPTGLDVADGPAALLPNGNVLVMTSPAVYSLGARFFEWDGLSLNDVTNGNTDAPRISSYYGNMLVLPTGEILFTDFLKIWIYQSVGTPSPVSTPQIVQAPSQVSRGSSYTISGYNLNGLSQGAAYGDDVQAATNYPLVRITNLHTGHVFYARTHGHSTMAVAYQGIASTTFDVAANTETGASSLELVANGIASPAVAINVQ